MSEFIDRIADVIDAMTRVVTVRPNPSLGIPKTTTCFAKDYCRAIARDVIRAMREPTEAMKSAVVISDLADYYGAPSAEDVWSAMIDAALSEAE